MSCFIKFLCLLMVSSIDFCLLYCSETPDLYNKNTMQASQTNIPAPGKFKLLTTLYNEKKEKRYREFITCIENNLKNTLIDTIHVVYDTCKDDGQTSVLLEYLKSKKIKISYISGRASFGICLT